MAATPDIATIRSVPPWRQKLDAFWRWWTGELTQLMPERFVRGSRVPVLAQEGGEVILVEPRSAAGPTARVSVATLEVAQARAALLALLERAGEARGRARACLGRDEALLRRVTMPAATEENLAQVIAFEMDRLTPFRAEEVYFDQRVISRDAAAGQILVQVAVARRELVDARVAQLRDLGVSVQGVAVAEDASGSNPAFDLLPSAQRGERESANERLVKRVLAGAVVALLLVAAYLPAWQKRETLVAVYPLLGKAQQDAQATDALGKDLERMVSDYNFLLAKKHAPTALAYLEDISRLLPDNTWVQQFDLRAAGKSREVQITGETASSSKLIELLEQSTLLQNATPRGTVTRGSQPGTERFMIAAETRSRPLPAMLAAREVPVVAAPVQAPVAAVAAPPPVAPAGAAVLESNDVTQGEDAPVAEAAPAPAAPIQPVPLAPPPTARVTPVPRNNAPASRAKQEWLAEREAREREPQARRDQMRRRAQERMQQRSAPAPAPPSLPAYPKKAE
jgi:general secretion pathway protein L